MQTELSSVGYSRRLYENFSNRYFRRLCRLGGFATGPRTTYFTDYSILYASTDKNEKVSFGALRAKPDLTIDEISPDAAAIVLIGARNSWRELPKRKRLKNC